jgi:hypothetical protein
MPYQEQIRLMSELITSGDFSFESWKELLPHSNNYFESDSFMKIQAEYRIRHEVKPQGLYGLALVTSDFNLCRQIAAKADEDLKLFFIDPVLILADLFDVSNGFLEPGNNIYYSE